MAATNTTITPVSRISRIFGINYTQVEQEAKEDWYIPYHGPYETPKDGNRTSVSSGRTSVTGRIPDDERQRGRRKRVQSVTSTTKPAAARPPTGSIGDTPVPRRRQSVNNFTSRVSLASFLSFSTSSKKQSPHVAQIQKSLSRPGVSSWHIPDLLPSNTRTEETKLPSIPQHPYAMVYTKSELVTPDYFPSSKGKERVAFAKQNTDIPPHVEPSRASLLRASISTPDLRTSSLSRGRRHWLSAETWCDALLFPRPRFTMKHIGEDGEIVNGKALDYNGSRKSRTLTKSKSVVDLRSSNYNPVVPTRLTREENRGTRYLRPKSFALDDISIPSVAPSITTVLVEAQKLNDERSAWRKQASHSPFNKRSRSLSRSRSKSQSSRTRLVPDAGTFDFLAVRTLLGSQSVAPVVHNDSRTLAGRNSNGSGHGVGTISSGTAYSKSGTKSHGHSLSLGTISDKPATTGLALKRTRSFGTVLRKAKTTAAAAFSTDPILQARKSETLGDLEKALQSEGTKLINLSDRPRQQSPLYDGVDGISPTPSALAISVEEVGIAFSFTPSDGHSETSYEEPIRMPSHPYAPGGAYSYSSPPISVSRSSQDTESNNNPHRQPVVHPYAAHGGHLSPVLRQSGISPTKRMFAEMPVGVIREILPDEIQYSPFITEAPNWHAENGSTKNHEGRRDSPLKRISSTLNMGEALGMDMSNRGSPDSGVSRSENHHPFGPSSITASPPSKLAEEKKPVQRRPVDPPKMEFNNPSVLFPLPNRNTTQGAASPETSRPGLQKFTINNSNHVSSRTPSSGNVNPSFFSSSNLLPPPGSESSASPPAKSHDSSPCVSPQVIDRLDDFERYEDLFYKLDPASSIHSRTPSVGNPQMNVVPEVEHEHLDINRDSHAQTDRSLSGMTWIAREMSELVAHEDDPDAGAADMTIDAKDEIVMVGRRFGRLKGPRPMSPEFHSGLVLSSRDLSPAQRIPEDAVQASSESEEHISEHNQSAEEVRLGVVEAVTTPPPTRSLHRKSSQARIAHTENEARFSSLSDPVSPSTGVTRSSYMTGGTDNSRISGLSDFPRPPSAAVSIVPSYYLNSAPNLQPSGDDNLEESREESDVETETGPRADFETVRLQGSRTTFGGDAASDFRTDAVRVL